MDETPDGHIEFYEVIIHGTDLFAQENWRPLFYCRIFNNYIDDLGFDI